MVNSNKEQKREAWDFAININQLDGEWIPSDEYKELVEKYEVKNKKYLYIFMYRYFLFFTSY